MLKIKSIRCCCRNEKLGLTYCCMKLDELEFTASFDALVGQLIYDQFGPFLARLTLLEFFHISDNCRSKKP